MKLRYSPGACSLSPHIVAREAGVAIKLEKVDLDTLKTETGKDLKAVTPKAYVPALELDDGSVLTEGAVIVQYLADKAPATGLVPAAGSMERYRVQEWLNYVASEVHKTFGGLFNPAATDDQKKATKELLNERFKLLEGSLKGRNFLMGEKFTAADAYLFTVLSWSKYTGVTLPKPLADYVGRVAARPAVQAALKAEDLL